MQLIPDEQLAAVLPGESRHDAFTVVVGAFRQITRDAHMERAVAPVRHDVNAGLFHRHEALLSPRT